MRRLMLLFITAMWTLSILPVHIMYTVASGSTTLPVAYVQYNKERQAALKEKSKYPQKFVPQSTVCVLLPFSSCENSFLCCELNWGLHACLYSYARMLSTGITASVVQV